MYSFISLITCIWILFPDYDKNSKLKVLGGTNIGDIERSSEFLYLLNINLSADCWYVNFMYVLPIDLWIIVVFFAQMFLLSWTSIFFQKNMLFQLHSGLSQMLPHANCNPYDQVIEIPNDKPNVLLYPSCVRLKQCGGCCGHPDLMCKPTQTKTQTLQVCQINEREFICQTLDT